MSEESFTFWDLFFTDNFGPSVWAKTAIVLTFAEDIFGGQTLGEYPWRELVRIRSWADAHTSSKALTKERGYRKSSCRSPARTSTSASFSTRSMDAVSLSALLPEQQR